MIYFLTYQINKGVKMLRVVKVRLYPTLEQQTLLSKIFGSVRFVYNTMLDKKIKAYQLDKTSISAFSLIKELPIMKNSDFDWLKEVDSTALQQSIKNMDSAYKSFFKGGGFPKFKSKHQLRQSYQTTTAKILNNTIIKLPKLGNVEIRGWREFEGKLKTVTVSFYAGQYHASLIFDDGKDFIAPKHNGKEIGLDIGVKVLATLSDGTKYKPLELTKEIENMIKAQKSLSRKRKGSKNRAKAKKRLSKKHLKISNKRKDYLHKISKKITDENQVIVVEDLKIKNMTKNARGTVEEAKKSSGKRGLNRVIIQQGWGIFFQMLEYKALLKGGEVKKVNPQYTSQKCSCCGHISKENRKTQSRFKCINCNFTMNADLNASINILNNSVGHTQKAS